MSLSYFHFLPARSRVGVKDLNLHAKVNIVKVAAGFVRERDLYEFLELNYVNILFPHAPQIIEQETNIWHCPCISIYNLKIRNSVLNHFTLYICSAKRSRPWFIRYFICASSCQREGAYFFSAAAVCEIYDFLFIQSCIALVWVLLTHRTIPTCVWVTSAFFATYSFICVAL